MLKHHKGPGWLVFILIVIAVLGAISQLITRETDAVAQTNHTKIENTSVTKVDNTVSSKYPGLHLRTETKETGTYTSSISIPITKTDIINEPIQKWIKAQQGSFLRDVELNQQILGGEFRAHLNIQLDTKKVADGIYSLVFTSYQITGGANGQNFIKPFIVDINNNKILRLEDIIDINAEFKKTIQSLVKEELQKDEALYFYVMDELIDEKLEDVDNWKWSISKKAFTLYFDEYEIAAGAAGDIKVDVPIDKIQSYLNERILNDLKIPKQPPVENEEVKQEGLDLDPNGKYIALTFDDGPNAKVTPRVLDILKRYDAKATFFMLGKQVEYYPKIATQVVQEGHEIGSHSNNHPDMTKLSKKEIMQELNDTSQRIEQAAGIQPKLFRPPYGACNDLLIKSVEEYDNSIILWSVDSLDWQSRNAAAINKIVQRDITPGAIILMHDIHSTTADALPELLTALKKDGYQFITVSQLLELQVKTGVGPFHGKRL